MNTFSRDQFKKTLSDIASSDSTRYLEHYKLAINGLNAEMDRFWRRFEVLVAVETALAVGIIVKLEVLLRFNKILIPVLFIGMLFFTLATWKVVSRGHEVYGSLLDGILLLEEAAPDHAYLLKTVGHASKVDYREAIAMNVAKWIVYLFLLVWIVVFIATAVEVGNQRIGDGGEQELANPNGSR